MCKKGLRSLGRRVHALESASQIKRSYTDISNAQVTDTGLSGIALDHVPISTTLTSDAYGRQANTTKVVGKKLEGRFRYYSSDDTPEICQVKVLLLRSSLESATVPGQIVPPTMAQLYDLQNLPPGCKIPQWKMFKIPGSLTDVYKKVQILKQWEFYLSCTNNNSSGQITNNLGATADTENVTQRTPYPISKWVNFSVKLNNEVFKFGTGTATVPIGPYRYFLAHTSTAELANHEDVLCSGICKFTYKDD